MNGKLLSLTAASALAIGLAATPALAQNAKVAAATQDLSLTATGSFSEIFDVAIRVPQKESLVFHVSLECGLYTRTLVKSKGGNKETTGSVSFNVFIYRFYVYIHGPK